VRGRNGHVEWDRDHRSAAKLCRSYVRDRWFAGAWINWADLSGGGGGSTERRPISSLHPGGAQCAYADASVHFIPETVDATVWRNTGSIGAKDTPTFNP